MKQFEDKFMEVQASMISLALDMSKIKQKKYTFIVSLKKHYFLLMFFIKLMEFMSNSQG